MVAYYRICKRKLWFFYHGLDMEQITPTVDVIIGRVLSLKRFPREKMKEFQIDDSVIDFIKFRNQVIVHEIKKSKKFEEAHIWQIKYYIFLLRKHGIEVHQGVIHYPKSMRKIDVSYKPEDELMIKEALEGIKNVVTERTPPPAIKKSFCKKCSYYELCYI